VTSINRADRVRAHQALALGIEIRAIRDIGRQMSAPLPVRRLDAARLLAWCTRNPRRPRGRKDVVMLVTLAIRVALQGCQAPPSVVAQKSLVLGTVRTASVGPPRAVLATLPSCLDNATATLTDGVIVHYEGAALDDPQVCVVSWQGKAHRYLAGFWGGGRFRTGTLEERNAIIGALIGPVGTETSFVDTRADLWGKVTVEHIASPLFALGDGQRRAVELRVIRHDARGRPNVQREALHWIDMRTGVALRRQTVTQSSDGEQRLYTTWQVDQLADAAS